MKKRIKFKRLIRIEVVFIMIFLLIVPYSLVYADTNNLGFRHITSLNGLSHDTIYSIAQDKDGFMWFGTEDGINKYDGNTIKVYGSEVHNKSFLQNANCSALYVDKSNSIWIASWGGGLEVLNPRTKKIVSYVHEQSDSDSISDNNVQSIFEDSKGTLWIGTYTKGLNKFDPDKGKFTTYIHDDNNDNSLSSNRVWSINEDSDGSLLIGTDRGLDKFDPESGKFTHFDQEIKNRVRTIYKDKSGTLWLGTENGLCKFDTKTREYKYYLTGLENQLTNIINSIYEDSRGTFWVGSSNGLDIFNRETGEFDSYKNEFNDDNSLSNNDIRSIFEDKSSNLWIGTRGGGVNKIDIKPRAFKYYGNFKNSPVTLSDSNVNSVIEDSSGMIWIGTNNGGLDKFNKKSNEIKYFMTDISKNENRSLNAMVEDGDYIWIGSSGGLNKFNKVTGEIVTYKNEPNEVRSLSSNTILSIFKDSNGVIWVGTVSGGLNQYDKNNDTFINYISDRNNPNSISSNTVNCIYEDSLNNLWIGTQNGLNKFDRNNKVFTSFKYKEDDANSISSNIISCIYEDRDKTLWIGTQTGLNKFDKDANEFKLYTTKDGLPNNQIHSILEDVKGNLWIGTSSGISMFNRKDEKFNNYDSHDGIKMISYNNNACTKTQDGEMIFCGNNGFNIFNPNDVNKSEFNPPIVISNFIVMGKKVNLNEILQNNEGIKLKYTDKIFSMEFSSLDFTNPEKNKYAYKLEGFDKDWNYTGSRRYLSYTNLKSGNYVLKIKGTNSDGVWNEEGISIPITVVPPIWANIYAYVVYIIAAILLVYLVIRYISIKKTKKLEKQFQSIAMSLSSTLDINEVIKRFLENLIKIIPYDKAGALIKKDDNFRRVAVHGFSEKERSTDYTNTPDIQKILNEIKNIRLPYILNKESVGSWLGIPIIYNDNVEGVIILFKYTRNFYREKEIQLGSVFASQACFAFKNANLYNELQKVNQKLSEKAIIDELTGLYNRRGFNINGKKLYKSVIKTKGEFVLCFGDLDGLKFINDTFGHKEGDNAIITAAKLLKNSFGKDDIIARMGGDEFTMIAVNKSSQKEIDEIIERIKHNFEEYNLISKKPYKLAISMGISVCLPDKNVTFEELIHEADSKLYEEKKNRKN